MPAATPVLPLTRTVFVLGVCLTAGTGAGLYAFPDRTADYWAWTIAAEPSAAFFGAGYLGAAVALALATQTREWQQARVIAVLALTLTSLALLVTVRNLEPFAFGEGGAIEAIAWIWLAVYVALPPLLFAAFVLQEHAGGSAEYNILAPLLRSTQLLLGCSAIVLGSSGVGLLIDWGWLSVHWPWNLTPLTAGLVGTWLVTYAVGFFWCTLRERDWRHLRIAVLPVATTIALSLISAVRLHESFDGGAATALYLVALGTLLVGTVWVGVVEEGRLRAPAHRRATQST